MDKVRAIEEQAAQQVAAAQQAAAQQAAAQQAQIDILQQQLTDTSNTLTKSQQQIQTDTSQLAANNQTIAADSEMIQTLKMQIKNCSAEDAINIKNLLKSYTSAVNHNAALVKSVTIQDTAERLHTVNEQNTYLEQEKVELIASIEQHERDFIDLRDALPEVLPNTSIHTLDDYTLWILVLSYSLFIVSVIFYYCYTNSYTMNSILISTVGAAILSIFLWFLIILLL